MLEAPERPQPARLADASIGGLGLPLIRDLMSHCAYQRENGFNVLSLEAQHAP
jgi:hypothetical protein